ncbi:lipid-binding SYLF domain-containing protein [Roseomonas sp. SSH11]|uniref:Lipid-binding SYLF domain-containing protein n=1 Tax=Pararoseomonas baculiformis TaxID=2820812 RepID=A0ABS4AHN5_9PROT|nr:lipid-binding SYLF domain-containing protein [Pararoseomonas baculiformis]MBP0446381.1 lipid-binding SYLF domain-containing protein [Pararoseomonas baculiformis]
MRDTTRRHLATRLLPATALALAAPALLRPRPAQAATRAEIDAEVRAALVSLRQREETRNLFRQARATLIFPRIIQGGFIVGGQYGEGAALRGDTIQGYYNIAGASFGLLVGAQAAGLAMFFMTDEALAALMRADGWEIGTGPSVVVLDRGDQVNFTATTLREPVYAITFNQQGLMASISLNGTKITRINPS